MIGTLDVIDVLPFELAAALETDDFFADIPVVVAEEGNIQAMMERAQAVVTEKTQKRGVAVIVLQVVADDDSPEVPLGALTLKPSFQVIENVELNNDERGTKKSARRVARRIRDVIKTLALPGIVTEFVPDKPVIEPVNLKAQLGELTNAYQVNFKTWEADDERISQVVNPTFAEDPDSPTRFTLACDTDGAAIWFTTDGSFPGPDRTGSILYSGPVEVPASGAVVRARGYKGGWIASHVVRQQIETDQL